MPALLHGLCFRSWDPIGNKLAPIARLNGLSWFVSFGVSVLAILDGIVAGCPAVHSVVVCNIMYFVVNFSVTFFCLYSC